MHKVRGGLMALALVAGAVACSSTVLAAEPDGDAAQALIKKNECGKCHSLDRDKKAPSWKKIASKEKAKPDIEAKLVKHLTSSPKVKLEDGTEEEHKAIKGDAAEVKNLIQWILTR